MTKKILIVEDDGDLAELVGEVLKDDRYEIIIFNDGKSAMDYLTHTTPDFIVMDVVMPHATGIEVFTYIANTLKKEIPILFISGSSHISKILKEKKTRFCYFLQKPFDYTVFVDVIKYFFEKGSFEDFKAPA